MGFYSEYQDENLQEIWNAIASNATGSGLLTVTGDTYRHRKAIAGMGGTWDNVAQAWRVPASRKLAVSALRGVVVA
jgi:hypothetical protein